MQHRSGNITVKIHLAALAAVQEVFIFRTDEFVKRQKTPQKTQPDAAPKIQQNPDATTRDRSGRMASGRLKTLNSLSA